MLVPALRSLVERGSGRPTHSSSLVPEKSERTRTFNGVEVGVGVERWEGNPLGRGFRTRLLRAERVGLCGPRPSRTGLTGVFLPPPKGQLVSDEVGTTPVLKFPYTPSGHPSVPGDHSPTPGLTDQEPDVVPTTGSGLSFIKSLHDLRRWYRGVSGPRTLSTPPLSPPTPPLPP